MKRDVSLLFIGEVVKGIGRHQELGVPGRSFLPGAPSDWPEQLFPGSLNLRVTRYPDEFDSRQLTRQVSVLDHCGFEPAFVIPWDAMRNNQLIPDAERPRRGRAQVWRSTLMLDGQPERACWVLRRIHSGLRHDLEFVSETGLRRHFGVEDESRRWPASARLFGKWSS